MKILIKALLIFIVFIIFIIAGSVQQNNTTSMVLYAKNLKPENGEGVEDSENRMCVYDENKKDFISDYSAKVEELTKYFISDYYINAVIAVAEYTGDDLKVVADEISKLIVFSDEIEINKDVDMILQAYIYGKPYIRYLKDKDIENSYAISKEYNESLEEPFKDKENFYLKILQSMDDGCTLDFSDGFIYPLAEPFRITNDFDPPKHYGTDVATFFGDDLYAITSAKVVASGAECEPNGGQLGNRCGVIREDDVSISYGLGNYVVLEIQNEDSTYYIATIHMEHVYVATGDFVNKGQIIGTMGNSGNSSGAHCHVEIRKHRMNFGSTQDNYVNLSDFIEVDK